ncbi:hypothetical protein YTCETSXE_CDS0033 [Staphylococcus phage MVC_VPHSA2]|uniref:DUF3789 domain-containing protein n=1 Tax=Staphylococcus phage MVC_VPHSA1 TaxID=3088876 RepID=A0ABZ0QZZ0_9CAUD|nr:hypothetical protein FBHYGVHD_CDS0100 [Staphylococcus phage MVC_VPHSA1]WPF64989.1 hypothetical protein YTCETSXE_CDS0033 [Staphylococcus phage MVC_VPHSA2]
MSWDVYLAVFGLGGMVGMVVATCICFLAGLEEKK